VLRHFLTVVDRMGHLPTTALKHIFFTLSFLMPFVPLVCLLLPHGTLTFQHLTWVWIATAAVGIVCAFLGGGRPIMKPTSAAQFWALALNGAFLLLLGFLHLVGVAHLD
jgi:hypothetical protein